MKNSHEPANFKEAIEGLLPDGAMEYLSALHREFEGRRQELLAKRKARQLKIDQGDFPHFLESTESIRKDSSWKVTPPPKDLEKRWVEITGPTDKKMVINGLNSKADVFMADFEDANTPTLDNMFSGQDNLRRAVNNTLTLKTKEKTYRLNDKRAVLMVRPRGWHLPEQHFFVDETHISGSLFDAGLFLYHNAKMLLDNKSGPYFYLPKMESHEEARLWNDVFNFSENYLKLPKGSIRCTVLIETITAAFEMEEILYELKERITGLNAGRWDYIFSIIKKFQNNKDLVFPDRKEITMLVPFMKAYADLLVHTCHKRGAHAMGGMAAFIPKRGNEEVNKNAFAKVIEDKEIEVKAGFDGTWVAHPDLVPIAYKVFEEKMSGPNQKSVLRQDALQKVNNLLQFNITGSAVTKSGVHHNARICLAYLASWLSGVGAAAIDNLMEDLATCEISRALLWQWIHHKTPLQEGGYVTRELVGEALNNAQNDLNKESFPYNTKLDKAREYIDACVFAPEFVEFLSLECLESTY